MSLTLPVVTITGTTPISVSVGTRPGTAALVIANESPYVLAVGMGGTSAFLPAWTADLFPVGVNAGFGDSITLTPQLISTQSAAPSSAALITVYGPGEPVSGAYPLALARLTNVGNGTLPTSVANAVIQSGETPPNDLVKASPTGYGAPTVDLVDTGALVLRPLSNNAQVPALNVLAGSVSTPAVVQLDNAKIATDGAGNLTAQNVSGQLVTGAVGLVASAGGLTVTGAASLDGGAITTDGGGNLSMGAGKISGTGATVMLWTVASGSLAQFEFNPADVTKPQILWMYDMQSTDLPFVVQRQAANGFTLAQLLTVDQNGNVVALGAVTAPNFHGNADSAQAVDTTFAGSGTQAQIQTTAATGLSTLETTQNGVKLTALVPVETDSTSRGTGIGYTDATGVFHCRVQSDINVGLKYVQTGDVYFPSSHFTGTGAGTYSHGLHSTPVYVGITPNQTNSTQTVGVDSLGSSTVHVNMPNAWPFYGMVDGS